MNNSPNELNFLPDDYLAKKAQRRNNVMCAGIFAAFAVAVGVTLFFESGVKSRLKEREASAETKYAEAAQRITQVQEMQEKQRRMARQAELTASLLEKIPRSYLLAEFTNALPAGVSLLDFNLVSMARQPVVVAATRLEQNQAKAVEEEAAPRVYDVRMQLTGLAYNDVQVAQYIRKLSESKLLEQVSLKLVEEHKQDRAKLRQFQLEMRLNPAAELRIRPSQSSTAAIEIN